MADELTPRMLRFIDEYVQCGNAGEAYRRAGYSPNGNDATVRIGACRLLDDPRISEVIRRKQKALGATAMVQAADLLAEVDLLATSDVSDILDFSGEHPRLRMACEIPARARKAISSIKVKRTLEKKPDGQGFDEVEIIEFKFWSKPEALKTALQRRGLLEPETGKEGGLPCKVYLNWNPVDLLAPPLPTLPPPDEHTTLLEALASS